MALGCSEQRGWLAQLCHLLPLTRWLWGLPVYLSSLSVCFKQSRSCSDHFPAPLGESSLHLPFTLWLPSCPSGGAILVHWVLALSDALFLPAPGQGFLLCALGPGKGSVCGFFASYLFWSLGPPWPPRNPTANMKQSSLMTTLCPSPSPGIKHISC